MPRPKSNNPPAYLPHKATGQARVVLNGRIHYLGKHGSPESTEKYNRLIAEYLNNGRGCPSPWSTRRLTILPRSPSRR